MASHPGVDGRGKKEVIRDVRDLFRGAPLLRERAELAFHGVPFRFIVGGHLEASFYSVDVIARLAPGASPAAARAEFVAAMERISARRSWSLNVARADIRTLRTAIVGNARPALVVLAPAAGLLLLIACVNAGNLLLLRAMRRARELAVRRALGATYADVAREPLIENILLGLGGAALGLIIAEVARRALIAAAPPRFASKPAISVCVWRSVLRRRDCAARYLLGRSPSQRRERRSVSSVRSSRRDFCGRSCSRSVRRIGLRSAERV